ncbi:DUF2637 domain-containing protein [Streptomyces sp. NPDC085946]|uniref:DUF2637 domain-containing protein n=1 Tax=Streptomyces sp. NPDC085946 TaxID=3365744 RepID=UPI0037D392BD
MTTVVAGAVVIAGIGFAGSYAAVRELAVQKGFGNFSYVFPIGIDAGICVLLALDLLLTWIRIPFPLLRQTAWLLTAATIAFNGAAAWPDPLGVGMHAVIPVLFVVSVEAARHAIGRIADITADKHMEGVRLTRWLLSPVRTFLLWRRMKLWELRSYDQVIKLEQERLVYQARLRSRFGRAWRRKAPVEALIPLELAKYGVPLTTTTKPIPSTSRAAIHLAPPQSALNDATPGAIPHSSAVCDGPRQQATPAHQRRAGLRNATSAKTGHTSSSEHGFRAPQHQSAPQTTSAEDRASRPYQTHNPADTASSESPADKNSPTPAASLSLNRDRRAAQLPQKTSADTASPRPPLSRPQRSRHTGSHSGQATQAPQLTLVDRYYKAWLDFQQQYGKEPAASELSHHLSSHHDLRNKEGKPISSKTLARYLLDFRIYTTWARHRAHTHNPPLQQITKELARLGITGQYNRPIQEKDLTQRHQTYERRWNALTQPTADHTQKG